MKLLLTLSLTSLSCAFHQSSSLLQTPPTSLHSSYDPTAGDGPALITNNNDEVWVPQRSRPRRNRKTAATRAMVRENIVTPGNFIYPLFIQNEDTFNSPILSMPGCERHTLDSMLAEVGDAMKFGVNTFVLFPKVPENLKTNYAEEAFNTNGIVHQAIRLIKDKYPDAQVATDVALDPYSSLGHDGVVADGKILNDITINQVSGH